MSIYNLSLAAQSIVDTKVDPYGKIFLMKQNFIDRKACLATDQLFSHYYNQQTYSELLQHLPNLGHVSFTVDTLQDFTQTKHVLQQNHEHNLQNILCCIEKADVQTLYQHTDLESILTFDLLVIKVYEGLLLNLDTLLTNIVLKLKTLAQHSLTVVLLIDLTTTPANILFSLRSILSGIYEVCLYSNRFSIVLQCLSSTKIEQQSWHTQVNHVIQKINLLPIEVVHHQQTNPTIKIKYASPTMIELPSGQSLPLAELKQQLLLFPTTSLQDCYSIGFCPQELLNKLDIN